MKCKTLQHIELGFSITTFEESVFFECKLLCKVKIPHSVTSIGDNAFQKCSSLKEIIFSIFYGQNKKTHFF